MRSTVWAARAATAFTAVFGIGTGVGAFAGGRAGVDRAIAILADPVVRTMRLLEVADVAELGPQHVTQLERLAPRRREPAACIRPG